MLRTPLDVLGVQTAPRREPSAPAFTLDPEEASPPPPGARTSQYAGVHWDSETSKWKAFPSISGQVLLQQRRVGCWACPAGAVCTGGLWALRVRLSPRC